MVNPHYLASLLFLFWVPPRDDRYCMIERSLGDFNCRQRVPANEDVDRRYMISTLAI